MPDIYFDVDTALSEVPVNIFPLTDDTDFKTRETGITYNHAGMDLVWNFVTTAGSYTQTAVTPTTSGVYDWTNQGDGMYSIEIPASGGASINNDTEGFGWFTGICTGVLSWRSPIYGFRAAAINNALIDGGDLLDVNVTHITDTTQTGRDLGASVLLSSGTGSGQISLSSGAVTVGTNNDKTGYTASTVSDKTGYALSSAGVTAVQTGLSTLTAQQVWEYATRTLSSFGTLIADVWSYVTRSITDKAGFTISGTKTTLDSLNDISASTVRTQVDNGIAAYDPPTKSELDSAVSPLALQSTLTTVAGYVDTEVAAIKLVTDKLDTAMEIDGAVYQFTTNALEHAPSSTGGDATAANQTIIINHLTDVKGATFSGTTDSLEAIRDRGDAAWVTGGGLSGSNTVLLTIQDGSSHNIVGAFIDIFDSANTTFLQRAISNSSGQVSFSMDDGTYYVRIVKSGYSFTAVSMVINGNYTHTYNMTVYTISGPALPTLCRVYTYIFKPDGTYHTTLSGTATVDIYTDDNQYYTYRSTAVYDNTTGLIYWDIVRGASAVLTITELEYFGRTITVPDSATSELSDL